MSLGARYDRFSGDCSPDGVEVPGGGCGPFEEVSSLSPKIGVRSQILPSVQLRASYSEGFALPEAQAKFATGAQNLDPNLITQVEAGVRSRPPPLWN
jgi:outer membrane receptor protein involved in Fe transport